MQNLLVQAGFTTEFLSPTNKDRAIQDILVHTIFKSRREEIEGLQIEGLQIEGLPAGMDVLHLLNFLCLSKVSIPEVFPLYSEVTFSATDVINAVKYDQGGSIIGHEQMVIEWLFQYVKILEKGTKKKLAFFSAVSISNHYLESCERTLKKSNIIGRVQDLQDLSKFCWLKCMASNDCYEITSAIEPAYLMPHMYQIQACHTC